jgi:hypothetical protein
MTSLRELSKEEEESCLLEDRCDARADIEIQKLFSRKSRTMHVECWSTPVMPDD